MFYRGVCGHLTTMTPVPMWFKMASNRPIQQVNPNMIASEHMWQQAEQVAQVYKLLANSHRLMILCVLLEQEELCVGDLNQHIDLNASPLSQHLKLLRDEGWLATRKQGQTVYYRIADPNIAQMIGLTKTLYCPDQTP